MLPPLYMVNICNNVFKLVTSDQVGLKSYVGLYTQHFHFIYCLFLY